MNPLNTISKALGRDPNMGTYCGVVVGFLFIFGLVIAALIGG